MVMVGMMSNLPAWIKSEKIGDKLQSAQGEKKGALAVGGARQKCLTATQTTTTARRETGAGKQLVKQKNIVT